MVVEYDATEAGDTCSPLPSTFPSSKPSLNVAAVPPASTSGDSQSPMSTRRRWIASLFTPRTARTARNEIGRGSLGKVIQALQDDRPEDEIADAGRRLLELCPSHDKVAKAANQGALMAIATALARHWPKPEVVVWLLPPLINLSSGDDDAGFARTATLVKVLGEESVLEVVCKTLRAHVSDGNEPGDDGEMRAQIVERCVWALQHLCRRDHGIGTDGVVEVPSEARIGPCKEWRRRIAAAKAVPIVCDAMRLWPVRTKIQLHGCNLLGTYVSGRYAGAAPADANVEEPEEMLACVRAVVEALKQTVQYFPDSPVLGAAVHALADVCCTPGLAKYAVKQGCAELISDTMNLKPGSAALQEGCCWAVHQLCIGIDNETREEVGKKCPTLLVRTLKGADIKGNLGTTREKACRALEAIIYHTPDVVEREESLIAVLKDQMIKMDVFKWAVMALKTHKKFVPLVVHACDLLAALCSAPDPYDERKNAAYAQQVIPAIVNVLRKNIKSKEVQDAGRRALIVICYNQELQSAALQSGANPDWSPRGPKPPGPLSHRSPGADGATPKSPSTPAEVQQTV